tara:strand:- start:91 stop:267 length:177 start_codon:yes stop_codon:yes gene_type:complete
VLLVQPLHQHHIIMTPLANSGLLVEVVDQVINQDQTQEELVVDHLLILVHMLVVEQVE